MSNKKKSKNYLKSSSGITALCPLCETKFNPFHARVLEAKEEAHLLHTQCQHCGTYIVSLICSTPFGLSSIGVITDLTAADVLKFKNQPKITCNDVIEFHQVITQKK